MARLGYYHHTILLHNNFVTADVSPSEEHKAEYQKQIPQGLVQIKVFDRYSLACFMDKEILIRPINRTREYTDREEQLTDQ